jgi:drug/metabolite transporter (DMT)-like permease
VLASQYAIVAVIGGLLVFRERLTPLQGLGVLTTMVGVAMLAVFRG